MITTNQFFQSGNARLAYGEAGEGEPVILTHGYTSSTAVQWGDDGVLQSLPAEFRVIALDNRGHGNSQSLHRREDYGREMALDALRLMDHLKLERAHILAYSLGAHIAAQTLTIAPERMATLTLGGGVGRWNLTPEEIQAMSDEADEMAEGGMTKHLLRMWTGSPKPGPEEVAQISRERMKGKDALSLSAIKRSMPDHAVTVDEMAASIERGNVPTLGIIGSLDWQAADMRKLKHAIPRIEHVEIEGATHGNATSHPLFRDAVTDFLKRHPMNA
ncbi:alpha/beta fold hydrolase [Agrobacterium sp. rho-13.3]|uniref:alpha/beta fold hydrolase n=1 Tax=Agrobacterium sp. rho-13.3 TaxID=3072980 RepID=UPI002A0D4EF1|nr:alpha/beta hydrolase [Agrobacterium sp. rho-13.3]MDX8309915.1 alpha/beta hydrolase [Agrobacterium sp. rho-13.3]